MYALRAYVSKILYIYIYIYGKGVQVRDDNFVLPRLTRPFPLRFVRVFPAGRGWGEILD